jgi:hypothetical protein
MNGVVEDWKRIPIAFLPLLHKEALNDNYKEEKHGRQSDHLRQILLTLHQQSQVGLRR